MEKKLLTLKELCEYLGIGESKARELLHGEGMSFRVYIGNRLYANKTKVDEWIDNNSGVPM